MQGTLSPIQNRIGVVFIPVDDMDRARAWYGRLFGVEPGEPSHEGGICDIPMQDGPGILLDANKPVTEHSVQRPKTKPAILSNFPASQSCVSIRSMR